MAVETLIIVRGGRRLNELERPLSDRGRVNAHVLAEQLRRCGESADMSLVHPQDPPAVLQTAQIIAGVLQPGEVRPRRAATHLRGQAWKEILDSCDARILIVVTDGRHPFMSLARAVGGDIRPAGTSSRTLPQGGAVMIDLLQKMVVPLPLAS